MRKILLILAAVTSFITTTANAQFVHPGITHNLADLDRMKYMVEAGIEPWKTSFENLSRHGRAQHDYQINVVNEDPSFVIEYSSASRSWFINDGTAAYYNALMWYITGDSRHAEKAIEIFNTYKGMRRSTARFALDAGRIWRIIEAAEIIQHTYDGWSASDIQAFKDMLVYPGHSNTTVPTAAIDNDDVTIYWRAYQGDPVRHGNQGLFAMRTMMAMGIFLDNEIMYDRALRYLRGQSHRPDDLPYPSGPPANNREITSCEFFREFTQNGLGQSIPDYGYNEVIGNYIFENGQSQESSRDQAHAIGGVSTIGVMAEMAWSQGDDLYGHLDNRPLLGLEFFYRYNLSSENSYSDQPTPWEPTIASGEYIERTDRSGRWQSRLINPGINCDQNAVTRGEHILQPVPEMNLAHYKDRLKLPSDDYKWLQRAHEHITAELGVENEGAVTDHPGYGGLKFRRVSPGDPVSGFDRNGLPVFAMNTLPMTIEAENFDYFPINGQDRTYSDSSSGNQGGGYRSDSDVDVQEFSNGEYQIGLTTDGEFLTYTVYVPSTGRYNIQARVSTLTNDARIRFSFDGEDMTGAAPIPNTGSLQNWRNVTVADNVLLNQGVQQLKVDILGTFAFDRFSIVDPSDPVNPPSDPVDPPSNGRVVHITKRNAAGFAVDGNRGAANSQNVYLWSQNSNNVNQRWIEIDRGNDFFSYQKQGTNHCLDGGNGGADRQNVYLWNCSDNNQNQHWQKVGAGNGFFQLRKRNALGYALDGGSGGGDGNNVKIFDSSNPSLNLHWSIKAVN